MMIMVASKFQQTDIVIPGHYPDWDYWLWHRHAYALGRTGYGALERAGLKS
jgi:hypothetical protein